MKTPVNIEAIPTIYHFDCNLNDANSAIGEGLHMESNSLREKIKDMTPGQIESLQGILLAVEEDTEFAHFVFDENGDPKPLVDYLGEVEFVREPQIHEQPAHQ